MGIRSWRFAPNVEWSMCVFSCSWLALNLDFVISSVPGITCWGDDSAPEPRCSSIKWKLRYNCVRTETESLSRWMGSLKYMILQTKTYSGQRKSFSSHQIMKIFILLERESRKKLLLPLVTSSLLKFKNRSKKKVCKQHQYYNYGYYMFLLIIRLWYFHTLLGAPKQHSRAIWHVIFWC